MGLAMAGHEFVARHEWKPVRRPIPWGAVNGALTVMTCGLWLIPFGLFVLLQRFMAYMTAAPVSER